MIPWTTAAASVRNAAGQPVAATEALAMLEAFMAYGRPPAHGWLRACMPHEELCRPETWGPRSPSEVDWTGFERRAR
jgi:hypothetical protein